MIKLTDKQQLLEFIKKSRGQTVYIFKHSTRCAVSAMVYSEFEQFAMEFSDVPTALILVIEHREVSNLLEEVSGITHQSPQVIQYVDEKVVWNASHHNIDQDTLKRQINNP